jgi:ATP/maltotriose-dependent transcriptional regulator MalT
MTAGAGSTQEPSRVVGRARQASARSDAVRPQLGTVKRLAVCTAEDAGSEDRASARAEPDWLRPHHTARLWDVSAEDSVGKALAVVLGEQLMQALTLSQWDRAEALAAQVRAVVRLLFTECDPTGAQVPNLTGAELRLLPLLATHLSLPQIGAELFLSPNTVKSQAVSIYRKLGVSSRREAVACARKCGFLEG